MATSDFEEANNHVVEFIHAFVNVGEGRSVPPHRGGKETLGRRALYERIMAYAAANGHAPSLAGSRLTSQFGSSVPLWKLQR